MGLKNVSDEELSHSLLRLVRQERKLTSQILDYLKEVEDRKLFAKRGYPSLFSYCTEFLGYSESAAQRRISAMRLLREVPQLKEQVTSGELSLSNVSKAASFFKQEQKINEKTYGPQEKAEILRSLQGKTQKEAEVQLIKISPKPFQNIDKERVITEELTELRFTLPRGTADKLNRLRELKPNLSTQELLDWMLSRSLRQIDPLEKPKRTNNRTRNSMPQRQCPPPQRRHLSKVERHQVWKKAKASCQFKDHNSGRCCQSSKGLEIDHIRPLGLGGNDQIENLRLLCREHHKLFTEASFS